MDVEIIQERGGRADVLVRCEEYSVIGDSKAFRLSRTALNPKDFKLAAMNTWRQNDDADYACLIGPYHDFPGSRSRLYKESVEYGVTLLSYSHLRYILIFCDDFHVELSPFWVVN